MRQLLFRVYMAVCGWLLTMATWGQDYDDTDLDGGSGRRGVDELDGMDGMMDYRPIRFDTEDIIVVVALLLACYVFGKIWKGCSYLIIVIAAAFYFLLHS